jgi:hypothetical protein
MASLPPIRSLTRRAIYSIQILADGDFETPKTSERRDGEVIEGWGVGRGLAPLVV